MLGNEIVTLLEIHKDFKTGFFCFREIDGQIHIVSLVVNFLYFRVLEVNVDFFFHLVKILFSWKSKWS